MATRRVTARPKPVKAPGAPKLRKSRERGFQRALMAWCATNLVAGCVAMHIPNEDIVGTAASVQARLADGMMPGAPDVLIVWHGRAHWIELKAPEGIVSANQLTAHARLRYAGCPVETAYCLDDAIGFLAAWGLLRQDATTSA